MSAYSYQITLSLDVFHSYFEKGICSSIQFVPGPVSTKLFSRYGFLLKTKNGGFELLACLPGDLKSYLAHISNTTGETYFDFQMLLSDGNFYQFTDFPVDQVGPMFYSSNKNKGKDAQGNIQLDLQLQNDPGNQVAGMIRLYFDDIINFTSGQQSPAFRINYTARSTQWQYYIINRSALTLDNPAIVSKSNIGFEGPSQVTIPTGEKALLFSSGSNVLPLSEVPMYKFDLVNYSKTQEGAQVTQKVPSFKTVFKGLPNPNPARMSINQEKQQLVVASPIYVYI